LAAPRRIPPSLALYPAVALLLSGTALAQEPPTPRPVDHGFHITAPRPLNGRGEWLPPNSDDGFLSTTPIVCEATVGDPPLPVRSEEDRSPDTEAVSQPAEHSRLASPVSRVQWRITVFRGGRTVGTIAGSGSPFTFRPADVTRHRYSGPLAVAILAKLNAPDSGGGEGSAVPSDNPKSKTQNPKSEDRVWLQQDEIDQLRQEYLDLPGRNLELVPRRAFIDRATYERAGELSIPWPDLNRTQRRNGGAYGHILFSDALRDGLRRWQELLGSRGLTINSGFRNPFKQCRTNGRYGREGAPGSMHQYGKAVDVRASLRQDFRDWVQVAWAALDAGADYVETASEGGWSHVHADWRHDGQGPPLTVKLEIAGRVVDAEGHPIPAARVLGTSDAAGGTAGMPMWLGPDAEGHFVLRTVWRPGRPYRLRAHTEREGASQLVQVPEGATGLVHLDTELVLSPDAVRLAWSRRSFRLASRGGSTFLRRRRYSLRRRFRNAGHSQGWTG
jgi:hypothetical protein